MRRVFLIIGACLLLALAGCGSDSSSSTNASTSTTSGDEATTEAEPTPAEVAAKEAAEKDAPPAVPQPKVPAGPPPKKLVVKELKKGSGKTARAGDEVGMEYVGVVYKTKEQFDANWGSGEPFVFTIGAGEVIKGWDEGIPGMEVGGIRELILPPNLAYGPEAVYPSIPANSTLVFVVKLVSVK